MSKKSRRNPPPVSIPPTSPAARGGIAQIEISSGPLPTPEILARYDAIVPGAAERILQMAEGEAAHMRRMDELAVKGQFGDQRVGQIFGLLVVFGAFVLAAYVASLGHPVTAATIAGAPLVGLASAFILGRPRPRRPPPHSTSSGSAGPSGKSGT